jgi:hypothetical protein
MGEYSYIAQARPCPCEPEPFFLTDLYVDPYEVTSIWAFYSSRSDSYNESWGLTGGIGAGKTLCCRAQWLGVVNDILHDVSSVESSCFIALLHWTWPVPWCRPVRSYHLCSHVQEWSAGPTLHYGAALLRSARLADASVTHERALETRKPSCVPRAAKPFFISVVHNPPGAVGHMTAPELPSWYGRQIRGTHGCCQKLGALNIKDQAARSVYKEVEPNK